MPRSREYAGIRNKACTIDCGAGQAIQVNGGFVLTEGARKVNVCGGGEGVEKQCIALGTGLIVRHYLHMQPMTEVILEMEKTDADRAD